MSGNGRQIIQVGSKGRRWFQIGEREPFEVDAVYCYSKWAAVDRTFRDEKGEIPGEQMEAWLAQIMMFVSSVLADSGAQGQLSQENPVDMGEALGFIKALADVNAELAPFFAPRSSGEPSSQESTRLHFST